MKGKAKLSTSWRVTLALSLALITAATSTINGIALSITSATITFPGVTLNGADQTVSGSTAAWRADANGESSGWNITVASTEFDNGAGKSIAVSNFEIRLLDSNITLISGSSMLPTSSQNNYTVLSASALKIISAASGDGNGVYDLSPDIRLTVPAETFTGSYSATLTISISIGP